MIPPLAYGGSSRNLWEKLFWPNLYFVLTQHGSKRQCSGTIKRGESQVRGGKLAAVAVPISEHNSTAALSPLSLSLPPLSAPSFLRS